MTKLEQQALELINTVVSEPVPNKTHEDLVRRLSVAVSVFAQEYLAKAVRDSFYVQRDETAPGVWLFCRHRDDHGDELIQDDRLWPRQKQAVQAVEDFIEAVNRSYEQIPVVDHQ